MDNAKELLFFPCLNAERLAEEGVRERFESLKSKILSLVGEDGQRLHDSSSLRIEISRLDKEIWEPEFSMIAELIDNPLTNNGEKINKKAIDWLKRFFTMIKKVGQPTRTGKGKNKNVAEPTDDPSLSEPQTKKIRTVASKNIMQRDFSIPSSWWTWSQAPRYYKLKVLGPPTEISMDKLIESLNTMKLTYSFKIHTWKNFSFILLNSENDRFDLAKRMVECEFQVEIPAWKQPQIKILYLRPPLNESWDEFIEKIMKMNGFHERRQYEIVSTYELGKATGKWGITLSVSPAIRSQLETRLGGRLSVGNQYVKVQDAITVLACRGGCNRLGHTRTRCRNQSRCIRCGQGHIHPCNNTELSCSTCMKKGHQAFSYECALYKAEMALITSDYDFTYNFLMM